MVTAVVRENKKKRRDRFVLIDLPQPLGSETEFTCKLQVIVLRSEWYAVGICDESNVFDLKRYHDLGHKSYLISANGVVYSSHDINDNW